MGLFSTTDTSARVAILPLSQLRLTEFGKADPDGDEADQTMQETKWHQASREIVKFKNLAADVASMTQEIKSLVDR
jgi:hypothetical protein